MNLKNFLKTLLALVAFTLIVNTTTFARVWYVNNQTGNDGRDGSSPTIQTPDLGVIGPKKTIDGPQGAIPSAIAGDTIIVAYTGVAYSTVTGEPATIVADKQLVIQSTGGVVYVSSLFQVATGALANTVTFNSGNCTFTGGLTLTSGTLVNPSGLVTISGGTITVAAVNTTTKVTGQLSFGVTVSYSYGATYITADEFPVSGTIGTLTTTAGNLTLKTSTLTISGAITTAGTLNLGGNVVTRTNSGGQTDNFAGNVSNGTLAYNLGGGNVAINGAVTLPTVTATTSTSNARTLDINGPTAITGTLTVSGKASVTSSGNTLVTIGSVGFTGDALVLNGTGTINPGTGFTTVNGNVNLSSTGLDGAVAPAAQINFTSAAALTINGNVTNQVGLVATNTIQLNGSNVGLITFPNQNIVITGNVVDNAQLTGAVGSTTNITGNGQIKFINTTTTVTINGAMNNGSNTTVSSSAGVAAVTGNGTITFDNNPTTAVIRIDGGIGNSSNWAGLTGATNTANGQIVLGGGARTAGSTIGTVVKPVGAITNSSTGATNGDGNGNITIGAGDGTAGGFFGTSVSASGSSAGGYITFGNENFSIAGNVTLSRSNTGALSVINIGTAPIATATVSIGGNLDNESKNIIVDNVSSASGVSVTGSLISNVSGGTISFPNLANGSFTVGGLTVSNGTVSIPVTATQPVAINGNANISGGTVSFLSGAAVNITVSGSVSFTGGAVTTTGRTNWTLNSNNITIGGAASNTTFNTATTDIVIGNPSPSVLSTVTIGPLNPAIPSLTINNTTGLANAVSFTGGLLAVAGNFTLTSGATTITNLANIQVSGNVVNAAGYTTTQQGRVSMIGGGVKTFGGAGVFGTIEFNNAAGFAASSNVTLAGTIYLTAGAVGNGGFVITINNTSVYPTIVVNAGSFAQVPTFNSNVNITYIGTDKATGNELPPSTTQLQNLTIATTNGANPGKGIVTFNANTTVNGILTVNVNQTLSINNAVTLTMSGASLVLNGNIINVGTGLLSFGAAAGTSVTGGGYLPNISIAAGSSNNMISAAALINQLLGTDGAYGGAADFDPTAASANGNLSFVAGTNSATFNFTGVAFDGSMVNNVTTNGTGNTLNLGANLVAVGTLQHNAGTINVGSYTFEQRGAAINLGATGTALFTGTGLLKLYQKDNTTNTNFTITSSATNSTISVNVEFNNADVTAGQDQIVLAGNPLIISGNLTLTAGNLTLNQNLTLTGSAFTITAGGVSGASTLILNAATPPLTFTYSGTPTINNLQISNDVNLAGTGTALTVTTFTHTAGVLNFGTENLTLMSMTRTGGSYLSSGGYMILGNAVTYDQGNGFSIPNLRFTANATLSNAAGRGQITVTSNLDLQQGGTVTTNGKLAVADLSTVNYTSGTFSAAPAYANTITLNAVNFANSSGISATVWPNTAGLVTTLTINGTLAGNTITIPGNRQVNGTLNLTSGVLTLGANTLTLSSNTTIHRTDNGSVTVAGGGVAFPADNSVNLSYESTGGAIGTGPEFPAVMNNLTVTRTGNVGNSTLTVNTAATVNGTLTIKNNFTAAPGAQLTVLGPTVIALDSFTNATPPVVTFTATSPLVFGGATGQTLTLPATGSTIGFMRLNLTGSAPVLNVTGGNLTIPNFGTLFFTNGVLNMGTYTLVLPNPQLASIAGTTNGLAFDRSAVTGANVGVVVGNISRFANTGDGGVGTDGRFEFPTGNLAGQYRPAAITFTPSYPVGVPTNIVVKNVDTSAGGTRDLPLDGGGVTIGNYPNFYWLISTMPQSMTGTQNFDIELTAHNIGYPYNSYNDLRMIRRQDGNSQQNGWQLQGFAPNYSNYQVVNGTDTTVTVRTTSSQGGLVTAGSRFTMGVPSRAPLFTAPVVTNYAQNEATTLTVQFTATAQDVGATITGYALNAGAPSWASLNPTTGLLTLTPTYGNGSNTPFVFTVTATSSNGLTTPLSITDTVHIVDRPPVFTQVLPNSTIKNDSLFTFTYKATDPDAGQTLTFSLVSVKPTPTVAPSITSAGVFTWTPSFADINKTDTVIVQVSDGTLAVKDTALVTIKFARKMGDVAGNGGADPASASLVLQYSVGAITLTQQQLYAADVDGNGQVNAYDAANILYAYAHHDTTISGNVLMKSSARGSVVFGKLVGQSNSSTVVLPISLSNSANVYSAYVELNIDNNYANIENVAGSLPQGWVMSHNYSNGVLKIAMAGTTPLSDGNIAEISLNLKDKETHFTVTGTAELNANYSTELGNLTVKQIPNQFELSQNYPNPFNPTTTIKYQLAQNSKVTLEIYDMLGQRIKTLVNDVQDAGYYSVSWDGSNNFGQQVSSGIYIYRLQAGSFVKTLKMNLLK